MDREALGVCVTITKIKSLLNHDMKVLSSANETIKIGTGAQMPIPTNTLIVTQL